MGILVLLEEPNSKWHKHKSIVNCASINNVGFEIFFALSLNVYIRYAISAPLWWRRWVYICFTKFLQKQEETIFCHKYFKRSINKFRWTFIGERSVIQLKLLLKCLHKYFPQFSYFYISVFTRSSIDCEKFHMKWNACILSKPSRHLPAQSQ